MLMQYALLYAIGIIILGILVINKDTTLMILNNITFKWIFERKLSDEVKKGETNITIKEIKTNSNTEHLTRYIGVRLVLLGSVFLIVVGVSWIFAPFIYVKEVGTKVYMDSPTVARNLIVFQSICTGLFCLIMTYIGIKWSNERYEHFILNKHEKLK